MLKLLVGIDTRTRYLDRAFPRKIGHSFGPMIQTELPDEPWAERYRTIQVPALVLPNIEKIYGAEALTRNESPIVTMLRYAANAQR